MQTTEAKESALATVDVSPETLSRRLTDVPATGRVVIVNLLRYRTQTRLGAYRDRVAARRGRNIAAVAAARELVELVYYALRDHTVRRSSKKRSHPSACQCLTLHFTGIRVDPMHLKNLLCQIQSIRRNFVHRGTPVP